MDGLAQTNPSQDVATGSLLRGANTDKVNDRRIESGKVYIIDCGNSRQLDLPPGQYPAILLPPSQVPRPEGITHLDSYSWNMYCLATEVFQPQYEVAAT